MTPVNGNLIVSATKSANKDYVICDVMARPKYPTRSEANEERYDWVKTAKKVLISAYYNAEITFKCRGRSCFVCNVMDVLVVVE